MTATSFLAAAADALADALKSGGAAEDAAGDVNTRIVALVERGPPQDTADSDARALLDFLDRQSWDVLWEGMGRAADAEPTPDGVTYLQIFAERVVKLSGTTGRAHVAMLARLLLKGGQTLDLDDLLTVRDFAAMLLDVDPADALKALEHLGLAHEDAEGTLAMVMATAVDEGVRQLPANVLAMMPPGYTPGPWKPPAGIGKNVGMWIGRDAHERIAEHYAHFHKPPTTRPGSTTTRSTRSSTSS